MVFSKKLFFCAISILFFVFAFNSYAQPADPIVTPGMTTTQSRPMSEGMRDQTGAFMQTSGMETGVRADNIVGSIIKTVLSLLGIVSVILIIFSGYQWMTAGGNEEQVKKAQSRIKNAVIGLIIIIFAYSITAFIFRNLPGGSSGPAGTTSGGACTPPCSTDQTCVGGSCQ